jgi:hypothetical protein
MGRIDLSLPNAYWSRARRFGICSQSTRSPFIASRVSENMAEV